MKLLCPWCLGELPGKPGQVAKCRHCASDIHWGGKTPFKTAEEARAALQQSALDELKAAVEKRDIQTEQAASVVPPKSVDAPAEVSAPRASNWIRLASLIEWCNDWRVRWREYREDRAYRKKLLLEHGAPDDLAVWWLRWRWYMLLPLYGPLLTYLLCALLLATITAAHNFAMYGVISFRDPINWGTITPEAAEVLAKYEGELHLSGLTTITPEVAEALAKHEGRPYLRGLTTITPEVAEALAKHDGYLDLPGITTITPEVAEALAKCKGRLELDGLTMITPEALKILRANPDIQLPSEFDENP